MNGKWNTHFDIALYKGRAQLAEMLGILGRVPDMSISTLERKYCTTVRPVMYYGSEVWEFDKTE